MSEQKEARTARNFPVGPATVPHRKNVIEWLFWLILWPIDRLTKWLANDRS